MACHDAAWPDSLAPVRQVVQNELVAVMTIEVNEIKRRHWHIPNGVHTLRADQRGPKGR
jgi:predicted TIM-barrel enzyme